MTQNSVLIIAVSILSALLLGAFMGITLLYDGDKAIAYAALSALAVLSFGQLAGLKVSAGNAEKIANLQVSVDGRLEQLLKATAGESHSAGVHQGEQDQRDRMPSAAQAATTVQESEDRIIGAVQAAVSDAAALAPPVEPSS